MEVDARTVFADDELGVLWLRFASIVLWVIFGGAGVVSLLAIFAGDLTALLPLLGVVVAVVFLARTSWGSLEGISLSGVEWVSLRGIEAHIPLPDVRSFAWSSLGFMTWREALSANARGRRSFVHLYSGGLWNRRRWFLVCSDVRGARDALLGLGVPAHPLHPWVDSGDA